MRTILLFGLMLISLISIHAQTKFGTAWTQGGGSIIRTTRFHQGSIAKQYYLGVLPLPNVVYFTLGHSNICDSNGRLVLLSDGYNLYDSTLNYIDGGKKLSFDSIYNKNYGTVCGQSQWSLILPMANKEYYFVNLAASDSCMAAVNTANQFPADYMLYHKVDMKQNGGAGKVVSRMQVMDHGRFLSNGMQACKHANGKDWWVFRLGADSVTFHTYLFKQDSVLVKGEQKFSGLGNIAYSQNAQIMFSSDGRKLICVAKTSKRVYEFDFNRCSGVLSHPKYYNIPYDASWPDLCVEGVCFSPNDRYFYMTQCVSIWQYDRQALDSASAWYRVAKLDTTIQAFQSYSNLFPGPDGKVYIGNWNGLSNQMSVIDKPNEKGIDCEFCPRCLRFDTVFNWTGVSQPPNMPDYNLGEDYSVCWPLAVPPSPIGEGHSKLLVYPNPTTSILYFKHANRKRKELYNSIGQLLLSTLDEHMDVSNIPRGMYYIRCENESVKVLIE